MHEILCAWHPKFKQDQKEIVWSTHAVQIDWFVSIWNARLGWNGLKSYICIFIITSTAIKSINLILTL